MVANPTPTSATDSAQQPASATPTIVPMLAYENARSAIAFLTTAFGFTERFRFTNDDGTIGHAELALDDGVVMLVDFRRGYQGPANHAATCAAAHGWLNNPYIVNGVYVQVDDVRTHFRQASAASGVTILSPVEDSGHGLLYRAADLEGQRWMFSQRGTG